MKRLLSLGLIALAAGALCPVAPAAAAAKADSAWGQCLWEQVPTSAANWLKMPVPRQSWRYGLLEFPPEVALQYRLQAACHDRLTPAGKRAPPNFDSKGVRRALEAQRPASVGPDKFDPKAYRCLRYFLNDTEFKTPAGSDWGFGPDTSKSQFFSMTYTFAAKGGGVSLPRQGGLRKCSFIQADGTFQDA